MKHATIDKTHADYQILTPLEKRLIILLLLPAIRIIHIY
jgi:hypothetical protein